MAGSPNVEVSREKRPLIVEPLGESPGDSARAEKIEIQHETIECRPSKKDKERLICSPTTPRMSSLWQSEMPPAFKIRIVGIPKDRPSEKTISPTRAIQESLALLCLSQEKNYSDPDDGILNRSLNPDIIDSTQLKLLARQRTSADPPASPPLVDSDPPKAGTARAPMIDRVWESLKYGVEEVQSNGADVVAKSPLVITTTDTTETSRPLEFINTSAGDDATPVVGIHIPTDEITLPTPEASSPTVSISSSFDSDGAVIMSVAAQSPDENREIATPPEADRSITSRFFSPESTVEVSINSLPVDLRVPVLSVVEQVIKVIQQPLLSASTRLPQVEPGLQSMPPHHAIVLEIRPISFDSKIAGERVARTGFEIRLIGEYARKERPSMESFKTELHKGFIATGFSVEEPQKSERGPLGRGNEPSLAFFIFPSPSLISLLRTEKMVTNPPVASREYSDQGGEGSSKDSSQDEDHQHQQDDEDSLST